MIERLNSPQLKLIVLLVCLLLMVSCRKENVCNLTPEQSPEIRGFQIGRSYDDIAGRFPEMCKPYLEKDNKVVVYFSLTVKRETNCEPDKNGTVDYYLSPEKYPDFDGINGISLTFSHKRLTEFSITYLSSKDINFKSNFENKSIALLGLSEWTNWKAEEKSEVHYNAVGYSTYITNDSDKSLLCNKFKVSVSVNSTSDLNSNEPTNNVPSIIVSETQDVALTASQQNEIKRQQEQQKQIESQKRNEEEKRKSETFRP